MSGETSKLLSLPKSELDKLYLESSPGDIPVGDTTGTAIVFAGGFCTKLIATMVKWFWWQGKVFDPEEGVLRNKISPIGFRCIKARVYKDKSWLDDKETIVLDYSKTSLVARMIRDEIRQIEPGLYLGKVWLWKWRTVNFALVPVEPPVT